MSAASLPGGDLAEYVTDDLADEGRHPMKHNAEQDSRDLALRHSQRFRRVANRYPLTVTYAYHGDIAAAANASDAEVAERVAAWERDNGYPVRDWPAIGRAEGRDELLTDDNEGSPNDRQQR